MSNARRLGSRARGARGVRLCGVHSDKAPRVRLSAEALDRERRAYGLAVLAAAFDLRTIALALEALQQSQDASELHELARRSSVIARTLIA